MTPDTVPIGGLPYHANEAHCCSCGNRGAYSDTNLLSEQSLSILTVGATKYFAGHNVKWTTDIGIGLEALTVGTFPNGVAVAPVTGWREDLTTEDGQIVIRSQMQILF